MLLCLNVLDLCGVAGLWLTVARLLLLVVMQVDLFGLIDDDTKLCIKHYHAGFTVGPHFSKTLNSVISFIENH